MVFTDEQLKGNWAEQYIASKLSAQGCLIRQVPQGHDSGIDLYCETTSNGKPFLHFWCQVKCRKSWGKSDKNGESNDKNKIWYVPKKKTNERKYWLSQPIPVYIIYVADRRNQPSPIFHIGFTLHLEMLKRKSLKPFFTVWKPIDNYLSHFLINILPAQTFQWDCYHGKVSPVKTPAEEYTKYFIPYQTQLFENKLRGSIRFTLNRLGYDIMFANQEDILHRDLSSDEIVQIEKAKPYVLTLKKYLQETNDQHYDNYQTIGFYYEVTKNYTQALSYMTKSLSVIESDPNIKNAPNQIINKESLKQWQIVIDEVKKSIKRIKFKIDNSDEEYDDVRLYSQLVSSD